MLEGQFCLLEKAYQLVINIRIESVRGSNEDERCFQPFLENIKDSAWIELGLSFHQEGTVNVEVHESFIIGRMLNASIFQSNIINAIF